MTTCARFVTSMVFNCKTGPVVTLITLLFTRGHHVIHTDSRVQGEWGRTIMEDLLFIRDALAEKCPAHLWSQTHKLLTKRRCHDSSINPTPARLHALWHKAKLQFHLRQDPQKPRHCLESGVKIRKKLTGKWHNDKLINT